MNLKRDVKLFLLHYTIYRHLKILLFKKEKLSPNLLYNSKVCCFCSFSSLKVTLALFVSFFNYFITLYKYQIM